jgi:pimeloyl-ACP methyl ester carboxylesterase
MPYVKTKDGVDIYYEVSGEGRPFLFLSETACDGAVWKIYQLPEFARDHRVVIFDYRGTGLSGKPSAKYSTAMFADDAAAVLDHLVLKAPLCAAIPWAGESPNCWRWITPVKLASLSSHRAGRRTPERREFR